MASRLKEYRYYLSSGVSTGITVKISLVELAPALGCSVSSEASKRADLISPFVGLEQLSGTSSEMRNSPVSEIFLTAQIFSDGLPLHPMVISSKSPTKCSNSTIYWNEWISFPVRYRDLSRNSLLAITIWGVDWVPVGGSTISFFTKQGVLRDGVQCLRIWEGREADSSPTTRTPSEIDEEWVRQECFRLDKLREKYERKEIARNEWMDSVTDRRIARIRRGSEPPTRKDALGPFCSYREEALLWLEMPYFGDVVVYEEEPYSQRNLTSSYTADVVPRRTKYDTNTVSSSNSSYDTHTLSGSYDLATATTPSTSRELPSLVTVWDPDLNEDNPAERKYRRLARDILRGSIDPNLKPSRDEKARIELLLATPTDNLKNEDKDLLWKFRYTLTDNKKAVVKFLLSVDWKDELEVKQATDLLSQWCEIDIADALKLLGREKEFKHEIVRHFAVSTLATAKNEDLLDFLLQLVQALRYEKPGAPIASSRRGMNTDENGSVDGTSSELGPLAQFLIARSSTNFQMANYFYWYLKVEAGDQTNDSEIFSTVLNQMLTEMKRDEEKKAVYDMLMAQRDFMSHILTIHNKAREEKGRKDQKEEKLRQFLKQFPWPKGAVISLPLDPTILLSGVVASSAKMFKSAMYPAVIQFQTVISPSDQFHHPSTTEGENHHSSALNHHATALSQSMFGTSDGSIMRESLPTRMISYLHRGKEGPMYKFMVKNGDDLRQDQLIMQMFILMDRLLKKVNLDLKLTPYRILATGANDGLMEFVQDSYPVSYVVSHFESPQIIGFLKKHNPDPSAEFGIAPEALSTYVKSVAGYCVLTYLLGIGDRHLDNLMMKAEGHMFHIDFGFVFGADPKPYPPPFKLTKEMVEGMGGPTSEHYQRFITYCCQAYNWLRKSADLILNLLSLMADSGIEELSANPATTLLKVEEKFRLDLTDEQAEQFFLGLINDSVSALFPLLVDWIHKVATKLK
ncbi:Phosphatidyl inositol kinase (PIK-A) [Plasmopara halstedii]|uniref:phosphatidylinositol 3-kinase n=1 Tax=Plasmopara halstedii TaxID=4781 RepID=A0A0P1AWI9_PLAHL|nr:Phosphatidyl inositol kinase (PIK-A) [Plasmopara halstedii]CEG46181.1 Phosphatidyl inositol kinase (PIK-A) [Plasmopara halstedii]|eukprot:XP_024582550.1 Phosphatidyl inositol kinase (PIK-A) [Plasmopara halstedii]